MASIWNVFNRKEDKEEEKNIRNAERIQDFINKFKVSSRDLDNSMFDKKDEEGMDQGWQGYSWIQQAIATSKNRAVRYKEYREMTKIPELEQSLNIYSDNSTQYNVENNVIDISSDNNKIVEILEKLFFDILDINANLWHYVRNMCKFGDEFLEVSVDKLDKPKSIISLERMQHPENMYRVEKDGNLLRFEYRSGEDDIWNIAQSMENSTIFQPWQIIHLQIEDEEFAPYGKSVFESGRATWKKLSLMEDAMLIYRISRAPERRVFYMDVGTLSTREANKFIEQVKRQFRKKKFINPATGEIDDKASPLAVDEDFFIPVRQNSQGTRIETLPGGQNLGEIDDVRYFKEQILRTLGIPVGYLGGASEGGVGYDPKSYLSNQEIQFARTIERIQKFVIKGLEKIAIIQLALHKIPEKEIKEFKIRLTPPSNVDQLIEVEIRSQQFGLIQSIRSIISNEGIPFLPDEWIYKNVLQFSDQEINRIRLQVQMQMQMNNQIQQMFAAQPGEGGEMGGGGGLDVVGGELGGPAPAVAGGPPEGGEEGVPPPEAGAEGPPPAEGGEEAGLEIASRKPSIEFDGGKWLLENSQDFKKLIEYIKLYEKVHKDNTKKIYEHRNSMTRMAIRGEFRGLLKAYKSSNTKFKTLNEVTAHKQVRKFRRKK